MKSTMLAIWVIITGLAVVSFLIALFASYNPINIIVVRICVPVMILGGGTIHALLED